MDQGAAPAPEKTAREAADNRRNRAALAAAVLILLLAAIALAAVTVLQRTDSGDLVASTEPAAQAEESATAVQGEDGENGSEQSVEVAAGPTVAAVPTIPYVQVTLVENDLLLSGVVPSNDLAEQLKQAAEIAYSPFVRSDLTVDDSLAPADWLAGSPRTVVLLQTITEGTILISDQQVTITGTAPSEKALTRLELLAAEASGLPVVVGAVEVTNLKPPIYVIAASDGQAAVSGVLPTEEIRASLVGAAIEVYGEDNVIDATVVDPEVYPVLWMYNGAPLVQALSAFSDYEIRLDDQLFTGSLSGAIFESNSSEIAPAFAQVLNFGVSVLTRDPLITAVILGHTDNVGEAAYNLALSQERADAVAAYVAAAGIDPDRVIAVGRGEEKPIAPNETSQGRARNRRVEIKLEAVQ